MQADVFNINILAMFNDIIQRTITLHSTEPSKRMNDNIICT